MLMALKGFLRDEGAPLAIGAVMMVALVPVGRRLNVELQRRLAKIPLAEPQEKIR